MTTAYRAFLPHAKPSEGWSVSQTWWFCILFSLGAWMVVGLIWGAVS